MNEMEARFSTTLRLPGASTHMEMDMPLAVPVAT